MPKKTQIIKDESKEKKNTTKTNNSNLKKKTMDKSISTIELYAMVEKRAYEIFIERGCTHGQHEQDWYQAEKEVRATANLQ